MLGIITLEDIIDELLYKENDEDGVDKNGDSMDYSILEGENLRYKEKLILLFSAKNRGKTLSKVEVSAICEFL
jgi:hypothetical protein